MPSQSRNTPSNVFLIVLDTVRAKELSFYGYENETMPNLRSFADNATVYPNAFTNAPWTLPAHASLFTGSLPSEHGCHGGSPSLSTDNTTLAEIAANAGYDTYGISNNIWVSDHFGLDRGFDTFYKQWQFFRESADLGHIMKENDPDVRDIFKKLLEGNLIKNVINGIYGRWFYRRNDFGAARTTSDTISLLENASEPSFFFLNFMEAHAPYTYHECTDKYIDQQAIENELAYYEELSSASKEYHTGELKITNDEFRVLEDLYDGELRYLDKHLGRLFDYLEESNQLEDSLVIIVGDHGENIGDHGLMAHRFSLHDTLIRVPLIIHYPSNASNCLPRDANVDLRNVYSLIKDVVTNSNSEDQSLKNAETPVIAEYLDTSYTPESKDDSYTFKDTEYDRKLAAVIKDNHKLVVDNRQNWSLHRAKSADFEIYGEELKDEEIKNRLSEHLTEFETHPSEQTYIEENSEVKHHLEDLGYI